MARLSKPAEALLAGLEEGGLSELAAQTRIYLLSHPDREQYDPVDESPLARAGLDDWELEQAETFVDEIVSRELYLRKRINEIAGTLDLSQVRVIDEGEQGDDVSRVLSSRAAIEGLGRFRSDFRDALLKARRRGVQFL